MTRNVRSRRHHASRIATDAGGSHAPTIAAISAPSGLRDLGRELGGREEGLEIGFWRM
jgi:hypothetical protein